jgi:hypothetical protein
LRGFFSDESSHAIESGGAAAALQIAPERGDSVAEAKCAQGGMRRQARLENRPAMRLHGVVGSASPTTRRKESEMGRKKAAKSKAIGKKRIATDAKSVAERDSGVYQLKVTLQWSDPPIWRRLLVRGDDPLSMLHDHLQTAFDWEDGHLHEFKIGNAAYSIPPPKEFRDEFDSPAKNSKRVKLAEAAGKGARFTYLYDFGDSWLHEIEVEKILPAEPGRKYPICIDGARAAPPEDCGGIGGYEMQLEILADPSRPEYEDTLDWMGEDFDPERFDPDDFNRVYGSKRDVKTASAKK